MGLFDKLRNLFVVDDGGTDDPDTCAHPEHARRNLFKCRCCSGGNYGLTMGRAETDYKGRPCPDPDGHVFLTQSFAKLCDYCKKIV